MTGQLLQGLIRKSAIKTPMSRPRHASQARFLALPKYRDVSPRGKSIIASWSNRANVRYLAHPVSSPAYGPPRPERAGLGASVSFHVPTHQAGEEAKGAARLLQPRGGGGLAVGEGEVADGDAEVAELHEDEDEDVDDVGGEGGHETREDENGPHCAGLQTNNAASVEWSRQAERRIPRAENLTHEKEAHRVVVLRHIVAIGRRHAKGRRENGAEAGIEHA